MQSRKELLSRLRSLERDLQRWRVAKPWVPGADALVPGTAAWIARKLATAQADHARIFSVLKFGAARGARDYYAQDQRHRDTIDFKSDASVRPMNDGELLY